jgi:hypothetical protein
LPGVGSERSQAGITARLLTPLTKVAMSPTDRWRISAGSDVENIVASITRCVSACISASTSRTWPSCHPLMAVSICSVIVRA